MMASLLNKIVQLLSKYGVKILEVLAAGLSCLAAFFLGKNLERRKNEKKIAELQKAIRKHDAEIAALEAAQKRSLKDRLELKRLRKEKAELEKELESYKRKSANA